MALWAAFTTVLPPEPGPRRNVAHLLKVCGWIVVLGLAASVGASVMGVARFRAALRAIPEANAAEAMHAVFVGTLLAGALNLVIAVALLAWLGWTAQAWVAGDQRAGRHVRLFALLTGSLALAALVVTVLQAVLWREALAFTMAIPALVGRALAGLLWDQRAKALEAA